MTIAALKSVFARAEGWSDEDQMRLARAGQLIEEQRGEAGALSAEDWAVIDSRAARNDLATDAERAAFFKRYRRP